MKILFIRFSSIGDVLLCTPIVRCVKLQKQATVHFVTNASMVGMLENNVYIDKVIPYNNEQLLSFSSRLRNEKYDLIIDLHKSRKSIFLSLLIGVRRMSYDKLNLQKWWYVIGKRNILPKKHLVDRYFEGIAGLGINDDGEGLDYFIKNQVSTFELPDLYNVLVLGATYFTKRIPLALAKKIIDKSELPVVLCGGNDVVHEGQSLKDITDKCIDLTGKTNFDQSALLLKRANHIYTGDTGMMHLAAALKKNISIIWGNTVADFGMYPYYGTKHNYVKFNSMEVKGLSCRPCSKLGYSKCPTTHFRCMLDQEI